MKLPPLARTRLRWLVVLATAAAAAGCGGETFQRKDSGVDRLPAEEAAGGAAGDTGGTDAGLDVNGDDGDSGGADAGTDSAGMDAGDAGMVLPPFVRVWSFDQPALGVDGWATSFGLAGSTV